MQSIPRTTGGTDGLRLQNLSQILTLVHRNGPLSRAELTRRTGFNRSTVGALVTDLVERRLVRETEPAVGGRVGRPSPIVQANDAVAAIAINPDIDAVTVGVVGLGGRVHQRIRRPLPAAPSLADAIEVSREVVSELKPLLAGLDRVLGVGVAVPGLVNVDEGWLLLAPHLGWKQTDLAGPFGQALGLPAFVANDAALGSLAESTFGAAVDVADAVYVNGSASGIGGGIIAGGIQLRGRRGYAGELGHTLVNPGGAACHCGRSGCLDAEVRLERLLLAGGVSAGNGDSLGTLLGDDPAPALQKEAGRQLELLAIALVNFVNVFDPQVIVLGGFLGDLFDYDGDRLAESVNNAALGGGVTIRRAALGPELLLVGAAELVFQPLLGSPA